MGVTIKEIAQAAGVCRATVDKVLHDRPGVSEKSRAKVLQMVEELRYQPNLIGQALKRQNQKLRLGASLLSQDSLPDLSKGLIRGAKAVEAFGLELDIRISAYPDVEAQQAQLRQFRESGVAGVILMPLDDSRITVEVQALDETGIPVVTINTDLPDSARRCFVGQNMLQAGRAAAQLISFLLCGRGEVAALTASSFSRFDRDRIQGFRDYLEGCLDLRLIRTAETQERGERMYRETRRILANAPAVDALYITCGCVASAVTALRDASLDHPVRIVCFDSFPETAALVKEGWIDCVIDQELASQGETAIRLLFEALFEKKELPSGALYTPIQIHIAENMEY